MSRIAIHFVSATAGGGLVQLRHFLRVLAERNDGHEYVIFLPPGFKAPSPLRRRSRVLTAPGATRSAIGRVLYDQVAVRRTLRRARADAVLCLGNFGIFRSPIPQVIFHSNPLYYSLDFLEDLRRRGERRLACETRLRRLASVISLHSATINVTPTAAFARQIARFTSTEAMAFRVIPYGFDADAIRSDPRGLPEDAARLLATAREAKKIVYVTHYNYFRNIETVLRALPLIRREVGDVRLVLTTRLGEGLREYGYDTTSAWKLMNSLGIERDVLMLDNLPHGAIGALYDSCDLSVCASYTETYGIPMMEAMSAGKPVVAADTPVHREVCGEAALYFPPFDAEVLARRATLLLTDRIKAERLTREGLARAGRALSWRGHVDRMIQTVEEVMDKSAERSR